MSFSKTALQTHIITVSVWWHSTFYWCAVKKLLTHPLLSTVSMIIWTRLDIVRHWIAYYVLMCR